MPYETQNIEVHNLVLSTNKQNAYATALADAALVHRPAFDGGAFANIAKEFRSDMERAGKGHNWGTEFTEIAREASFGATVELSAWLAGWLAAFTMGADTITGAGPYTHTCKFAVSSNIAPVTTILLTDTADLKYKMPDMAMVEIEISGTEKGPLEATFSMIGSGRTVDAPAFALPAAAAGVFLLGSDTDILIGAQAAAVSIKERVRGWKVKVQSGITVHRAPGGGLYASMAKIGMQRVSVSLVVAAKEVDDIRTIFLANTIRELQINTNSGAAAQLNIKFPGLYFSATQAGQDGNETVWNIESDERAVVKSGANEICDIVAINSTPTYLVGA